MLGRMEPVSNHRLLYELYTKNLLATCLAFILSLYFIISLVEAAKSSVSEDEKEPTKPESQSLEEKDTPQAGSTKTYRRKATKFETEAPEIKCMCHRPLELDNTRVL